MALASRLTDRNSRQQITFSRSENAGVSKTEMENEVSQTDSPAKSFVHRIWSSAVLSGLLAVILGAVILAWPGPSIVVTSGVFGGYLVVSGIAMVALGFSLPAPAVSRFLSFISGVASVILGILAFQAL